MGKISPISSKYIITSTINIDGVVDRPDVIGAIFGQTEGLLGSDLELRELQRSGRIGRIEVNLDTNNGKTSGSILIPSSLDKAETAIVGAALEIIQRIGPCNAKIRVSQVEDVRISKRAFVIQRAKELLKEMEDTIAPDSQELADEVAYSVRVMEISEYGKDRLPAGPAIDESEEILVVEGRADVLNMLKHGIKNAIAMNGTSVPKTIIELSKKKVVTIFVDGDRGGDLIIKELGLVADVDFVTKAPDGKEVEELTKKEIHKGIRSKVAMEQAKLESDAKFSDKKLPDTSRRSQSGSTVANRNRFQRHPHAPYSSAGRQQQQQQQQQQPRRQAEKPAERRPSAAAGVSPEEKKKFKGMLEDLIGTRGAYILDPKLNILGKVPISELSPTLRGLSGGVYAVLFDGVIDRDFIRIAEKSEVKYVVAMDSKLRQSDTKIGVLTIQGL